MHHYKVMAAGNRYWPLFAVSLVTSGFVLSDDAGIASKRQLTRSSLNVEGAKTVKPIVLGTAAVAGLFVGWSANLRASIF
jgi:hypothetical protein